jgi:hypothetical protein
VAGSIVPNPAAGRPMNRRPWKPMGQRRNPPRMETLDPTGSCGADRHGSIDKLQIEEGTMEAIRWFSEIGLADVALVGGKGASVN